MERLLNSKLCRALHIKGILRRLGYSRFERSYEDFLEKYYTYLVLKPFDLLFDKS
jgi:hypothetical protein